MCKRGVSVVLGVFLRVVTAENRSKTMVEKGKRVSNSLVLRLELYMFGSLRKRKMKKGVIKKQLNTDSVDC